MRAALDNKNMFHGRMEDLAQQAIKAGCAASRFLTPAEAAVVAAQFARRRDVMLSFDGGFDGAERTRAVFLNPGWGEYERADLFAALRISHRPQDAVGHRDILGALMALGIERDTVGDILADAPPATLLCLPEMGGYLTENLTKAGRVGVSVSQVSLDALPEKSDALTEKTANVASLRLDVVLCAAFHIPRGKAADLIATGLVALNHAPCLKSEKEVAEGATISVRGLGRVRLLEIGGTSRKGRIFIKIGLYGR